MQQSKIQIFKKRIKGDYKRKMFVFLILLVYVPLILVGSISGGLYAKEVTERRNAMLSSTEESVFYQVEGVLSSIKQYYMNLSDDATIKGLLEEEAVPYRKYSDVKAAQQLLDGGYYLSNYVSDYYFINLKSTHPWTLSKKGMYPLEEADNYKTVNAFIEEQKNKLITIYWSNMGETAGSGLKPSKTIDMTGEQLVMRLGSGLSDEVGLIMVKLETGKLKRFFPDSAEDYEVCIFDSDYKLVAGTNAMLGSQLGQDTAYFTEQEIKLPEGGHYRIRVNKESQNGLIYVTAYNMEDVNEGIFHILIGTAIVIAVLTLILIIWLSVSKLYKPVDDLMKFAEGIFGREQEEDEFAYIQEEVGNLSNRHEGLKLVVQQQRFLLRKSFFINLLRGELQAEVITANLLKFKLETCVLYRLMAVDYILETGKIEIENGNYEIEMLNSMVVENLSEEIYQQLFLPPVSYGEKLILLVGADTAETMREKIEQLHVRLSEHIEEIYGCSITVGVSRGYEQLSATRTAYHECMEALHSRRITESNKKYGIVYWEEFGEKDVTHHGYDTVLEKSLTKALDNCDKVEAAYLLKQILDKLDDAHMPAYEFMLGVHRLIVSIYTVAYNAGVSVDGVLRQGQWNSISSVFEQLDTIYNKERLFAMIDGKIMEPLIESLMAYRGSSSSELIRSITDMIQETRGDITLQECADRLNYHPSYIWKVLKSEENTTFTELANREKIRVAKELLLHTQDSIVDIAEKLHYSNAQNFSRFFGKYEQMTPGSWRKAHK